MEKQQRVTKKKTHKQTGASYQNRFKDLNMVLLIELTELQSQQFVRDVLAIAIYLYSRNMQKKKNRTKFQYK